jgi:hypothetical protein
VVPSDIVEALWIGLLGVLVGLIPADVTPPGNLTGSPP